VATLSGLARDSVTWEMLRTGGYQILADDAEVAVFEPLSGLLATTRARGRLYGRSWSLRVERHSLLRATWVFRVEGEPQPTLEFRVVPRRYSLEASGSRRYRWKATFWLRDLTLFNQDDEVVVKHELQWVDSGGYSIRTTVTEAGAGEPNIDWVVLLAMLLKIGVDTAPVA